MYVMNAKDRFQNIPTSVADNIIFATNTRTFEYR